MVAPDDHVLLCMDRRVLRVLEHVSRDLTRHPTLAQAAAIAGLERTYFCKHFQKTVGVNFCTWSRQIRVAAAKDLLANSDLSVTAIGMAVGYKDVTTFERNFRKCVSTSPRRYRRKRRRAEIAATLLMPRTQ
jgi:AraC-like DNA-binding protein